MEFQSDSPTIVKSIKQRDMLNTWLRLYAREQRSPRIDAYQPSRLADELPDLLYCTVDDAQTPPRLQIQNEAARISNSFGASGKGKYLHDYVGPRYEPIVMPPYYECVRRGLPVYTASDIHDMYGRLVTYERLLMPFSQGAEVTHIIASVKAISEDGAFEIRNLLRGSYALPELKLRTVIDRDLFHRAPGRIPSGEIIEFG